MEKALKDCYVGDLFHHHGRLVEKISEEENKTWVKRLLDGLEWWEYSNQVVEMVEGHYQK